MWNNTASLAILSVQSKLSLYLMGTEPFNKVIVGDTSWNSGHFYSLFYNNIKKVDTVARLSRVNPSQRVLSSGFFLIKDLRYMLILSWESLTIRAIISKCESKLLKPTLVINAVMPLDVLGCTRATLMVASSLQPWLRNLGNLFNDHRAGDRLL